jgi:brefeldin A-resistance guanine nucleotide exchange factor 1
MITHRIPHFIEKGIIEADASDDTKESLAHFLRSTQQLNKKSLGEYLGKKDNFDLLQVFMRQFNFEGVRKVPKGKNIKRATD